MNGLRSLGLCGLLACATASGATYRIIDLGPANAYSPLDINDAGQIVFTDARSVGFIWRAGAKTRLAKASMPQPVPAAINNKGQVTGTVCTHASPTCDRTAPFIWSGGTLRILPTFTKEANGAGINDLGEVVGYNYDPDCGFYATLWTQGHAINLTPNECGSFAERINDATQITGTTAGGAATLCNQNDASEVLLGDLGGGFSTVNAINDDGLIVGESYTATGVDPFLWEDGQMMDLGTLGGNLARANWINSARQVVGASSVVGAGNPHAFIWEAGLMSDLGTLHGRYDTSEARKINESGDIIGTSIDKISRTHAILWHDRVFQDLGLGTPVDINARGDVVGFRLNKDGQTHAVIWKKQAT